MVVLVDKYMKSEYKNIDGKENLDLRYVDNVLGKRYELKNLNSKDIQTLFERKPSKQDIKTNLLKLGNIDSPVSKSVRSRKQSRSRSRKIRSRRGVVVAGES